MIKINYPILKSNIAYFCFYFILGSAIYFPSLKMNFVSDDYQILKRIFIDKNFWIPGFFRPLGDVVLSINYFTTGFDPFFFHLTNVLIHAINTFLVFCLCRTLPIKLNHSNDGLASIAAILFLTYPFHSESVLWVISRSSAISVTFGLLSLIIFFKRHGKPNQILFTGLIYFIGLASFENIIVIPIIITMFEILNGKIKRILRWVVCFSCFIILHIVFRLIFSGAIWGSYGGKVFDFSFKELFVSYIKALGRLFLPPLNNTNLLLILFLACISVVSLLLIITLKNNTLSTKTRINIAAIFLGLLISLIIPGAFGVSSHTSEGGRLLYFPAVFWVILISVLLNFFIKRVKLKIFIVLGVVVYNLIFLFIIQTNWMIASNKVQIIKQQLREYSGKNLFLINLPGEYKGAYVFRNGLSDALVLWEIDKNVQVFNIINDRQLSHIETIIKPELKDGIIFIKPETTLEPANSWIKVQNNKSVYQIDSSWTVLYWNLNKFEEISVRH